LISTKGPFVLALSGELGSGKTTFIQGLAEGLGIKQRIISPTFILVRKYHLKGISEKKDEFDSFYHVDLYRLEGNIEKELKNLGVEEILTNPKNIIAIEWGEKAKNVIPKNATWVKFQSIGEETRKIIIE